MAAAVTQDAAPAETPPVHSLIRTDRKNSYT